MSIRLQLTAAQCRPIQTSVEQLKLCAPQLSDVNSCKDKPHTKPASKCKKTAVVIVVHPSVEELKWDSMQTEVPSSSKLNCPVPRCTSLTFGSSAKLLQHMEQLHPYHFQSKNVKQKSGDGKMFKFCCPERSCEHHTDFKSLSSLPELKAHYFRQHGAREHACSKCRQTFGWEPDKRRHETECGKDFKCPLCPARFYHEQAVVSHRLIKHRNSQPSKSTNSTRQFDTDTDVTVGAAKAQGCSAKSVVKICPQPHELDWEAHKLGDKFTCMVPGCKSFPFKRQAGLSQHLVTVHKQQFYFQGKAPADQEWRYHCPQSDCNYSSCFNRWFTTFTNLRYVSLFGSVFI